MTTVLADNIRKAAHGLHVCQLCRGRIAAGERYRDVRLADSGTVWTWREHLSCGDFIRRHVDRWDLADGYNCETYAELMHDHDPDRCPDCAP